MLFLGLFSFSLFYLFARDSVQVMNIFTLTLLPGAIDLVIMASAATKGVLKGNRDARLLAVGVALGIVAALHDFSYQFSGTEPFVWLQGSASFSSM